MLSHRPQKIKESFESILNATPGNWFSGEGCDYIVFQRIIYVDSINSPKEIVAYVCIYQENGFDHSKGGWKGVEKGRYYLAVNYKNIMYLAPNIINARNGLHNKEQTWEKSHQNESILSIDKDYASADKQKCFSYCDDVNRIEEMSALKKDRSILERKISWLVAGIANNKNKSK